MRILFLGINYWPEQTGIAPVTQRRCEYLASQGHEITICTAFPYYPDWRVGAAYRGKIFARETHNGVNILRSYVWVPAQATTLRRIIHEASFLASSLLGSVRARKPDLLFVTSPPLGLAVTAVLLSRLWNVPYVFDAQDLQPDAAAELGMLPPGKILNFLYALEAMAYRNAALVITITDGMRRSISSKGIPLARVAIEPSGAEDAWFAVKKEPPHPFRSEHQLADKFLVLHSGNMGVKQGLEVVLEAAARSRSDPGIEYLLVGDGAMRASLEAKAREMNLANVRFLPVQDGDKFLEILSAADVGLITQQSSVSDIVFPSKTVTLLAAGCPVIASVNSASEVARVVTESGGGVVVAPEDPEALLAAIVELRNDSVKRFEASTAGRDYARAHWERRIVLGKFEQNLLAHARRNH